MRNFSDKSCRENQNKRFKFNNFFFFENRVVYEIMWKNILVSQAIDDNMAHAHFTLCA